MNTVTVLLSTYNGERYLREQLNSIINQKNCSIKILVRDDGSSDSTTDILEEYQKKGCLSWYQGENLRPARSFYELILNSGDSDFYAFADQDDIWEEDKLEKAMRHLAEYQTEIAVFTSNVSLIDSKGNLIKPKCFDYVESLNFKNTLIENYCGIGCTMVYNRKLSDYLKNHEKPSKIVMHDYYILQVAAIFGKIIYSNEALVRYRQHEKNVVGIKTNFIQRLRQWKKNYLSRPAVSVTDQLESILTVFKGELPREKEKDICTVINYNNNLKNRIKFFFSPLVITSSRKRTFAYRVNILLGNF